MCSLEIWLILFLYGCSHGNPSKKETVGSKVNQPAPTVKSKDIVVDPTRFLPFTKKDDSDTFVVSAKSDIESSSILPSTGKPYFTVVAFGDIGFPYQNMRDAMESIHKFDSQADAVFLLGDNQYDPLGSSSDYKSVFDLVAGTNQRPYYAILGNHEHMDGNVGIMLSFDKTDPRWVMPAPFYFKKFQRETFTICVWFLDTEKFDVKQANWLSASLRLERSSCTWAVVNGHHPTNVHASEHPFPKDNLDHLLQPIIDKHGIHAYLCGHHHNSQHLTNPPTTTHYFIVGQMSLRHPVGNRAHRGQLSWNSDISTAYLVLEFTASEMSFVFIDASSLKQRKVLHSGSIFR